MHKTRFMDNFHTVASTLSESRTDAQKPETKHQHPEADGSVLMVQFFGSSSVFMTEKVDLIPFDGVHRVNLSAEPKTPAHLELSAADQL